MSRVLSIIAFVLASAALAVSLLHSGPSRGSFTNCERGVRLDDPSLTTSQVTEVCTVAQAGR